MYKCKYLSNSSFRCSLPILKHHGPNPAIPTAAPDWESHENPHRKDLTNVQNAAHLMGCKTSQGRFLWYIYIYVFCWEKKRVEVKQNLKKLVASCFFFKLHVHCSFIFRTVEGSPPEDFCWFRWHTFSLQRIPQPSPETPRDSNLGIQASAVTGESLGVGMVIVVTE